MVEKLTTIKLNRLLYLIGCITLIELVLCGSGQIVKFGPITLRMMLYVVCVGFTTLFCIKYRPLFSSTDVKIILLFLTLFSLSIALGIINGAKIEFLVEDIKPLSYFLIFPFLLLLIRSDKCIKLLDKIFLYIPLMMAGIYLMYLLILKVLGLVTFMSVYSSTSSQSDFMFRGTSGELFYKGFLYLPIGLIFWLNRKKKLPFVLILIAIFFTLTRGFYIITAIGILIYYYLSTRSAKRKLAIVIISIIGGIFGTFAVSMLTPDERQEGDEVRVITFNQVVEDANIISMWVGHGYGNGVPIRKVHMENSFLEIFQKSGILSICFWCYFLFCIYRYYKKSFNPGLVKLYYVGSLMVYIQSLFNPFITNPIGMGFVMVSYCVAKYYYKNGKNSHLLCRI